MNQRIESNKLDSIIHKKNFSVDDLNFIKSQKPENINYFFSKLFNEFQTADTTLKLHELLYIFENTKEVHQHIAGFGSFFFFNKLFNNNCQMDPNSTEAIIYKSIAAFSKMPFWNDFIKAIESLDDDNIEVRKASKEMIRELISTTPSLCDIVFSYVKLPKLIYFLPKMIHEKEMIQKAVNIFNDLLDGKEEFINDTFQCCAEFIKNLNYIPSDLFVHLVQGMRSNINSDLINLAFKELAKVTDCFLEYQKHDIGEIALDYLRIGSGMVSDVLELLYQLKITDDVYYSIHENSSLNINDAVLLISVLPRENEEELRRSADYSTFLISNFLDINYWDATITNSFFKNISIFTKYLSDESHSIIIESLLPFLIPKSQEYQEAIAKFLFSFTEESIQACSLYLENVNLPNNICPLLKASFIRMNSLTNTQPKFSIKQNDAFECARALLEIGEYQQSTKLFSHCKPLDSITEAFSLVSQGLLARNNFDHSFAATCFEQASHAFHQVEHSDFQQIFCMTLFYLESICFQEELNSDFILDADEPLLNLLYVNELNILIKDLITLSPNLYPSIDVTSNKIVREFCDLAESLLSSIASKDINEFYQISSKVLPIPPIFYRYEPVIYIENIKVINPEKKITKQKERNLTLELTGDLVRKCDVPIKVFYRYSFAIDQPNNDYLSSLQEIECKEHFCIYLPIVACTSNSKFHVMPINLSFLAEFPSGEKYLIEKTSTTIKINEENIFQ